MKRILLLTVFIAIAVGQFSCKKNFDINKNPNDPADVTIVQLLPAAQVSIGQVMGNYLQVVGGIWAQYWTQNPNASQYRPLEQYQPGPESANRAWQELYSGALSDLKKIVEKAGTGDNTRNYAAIAKILQGYTFQVLTDNFGDIPYKEALLGEDSKITSPKYDKQEDIYPSIIALVKEGRSMITFEGEAPGSDDIIYGGDMAAWGAFANTLLLKMYLRLAYRNPSLAQAGIAELQNDPYGFLGATAQVNFISTPGNTNPLYSEMKGLSSTQNLIASATSVDSMGERGDSRVFIFYTGTAGLEQGYYNINPPGSYSTPTSAVGALVADPESATAPVKLISSYESLFLQAEAAARGWMSGDIQSLYEGAIQANFLEYEAFGLTSTDADDYISGAGAYPSGSMEDNLKAIITEKWYSMNGNQNIEAWTEWRRTGYPDFFTISKTSRIGNTFPQRIPYPESEITRNLNYPGTRPITEKVWWDIN